MSNNSTFLQEFKQRGFFKQATDDSGLDKLLSNAGQKAYIGFDCTADSLHVGSLLQIMILRMLQRHGHTPIILLGGGTTKIGDPSGKDATRPVLTPELIERNKQGIRSVIEKFIDPDKCIIVDNNDWLEKLNYIEFLRDVGRHFSVNRMLSFDSVKLRLDRDQSLTFIEFNYMILQAYDFVELYNKHDCRIQIGGSDQWGNIVNGVELNRRLNEGKAKELYGLTTPLIATASGAKMGKTASGAVWLDEERKSPYDYYQFWRNTEDADVKRFLLYFTDLPLDKIEELGQLQGADINEAKKVLAFEATKLCHGEEAAKTAANTAQKLFEQGVAGGDLPTFEVPKSRLNDMQIAEAFTLSGLAATNGEVKRLVKGGGAKINDAKVNAHNETINDKMCDNDFTIKISSGKKKHAIIKFV